MKRNKRVLERLVKIQIKKGDTVKVLSGKDKGKEGKVLIVNYKIHKVTVEGINVAKKAVRPSQQNQKGGFMEVSLPIHLSNVRLICPKCNKITKIYRKKVNEKTVRICKNKKCNEIIDKV